MKVPVVLPPQAEGAPGLLFVNIPSQPPLADAVANQFEKAFSTAVCVWQEAVVVVVGQVRLTEGV